MIIAFSFLNLINSGYKAAIEHYNSLTTKDWLHFDVMDGKFVSNTTFNYELVKEINTYNKLYADVHLMCENPIDDIKHYAEAGAKSITYKFLFYFLKILFFEKKLLTGNCYRGMLPLFEKIRQRKIL